MVSTGAWPFLLVGVMRVLDGMCDEAAACDSSLLFNASMACVLEVGREQGASLGLSRQVVAPWFFRDNFHDITNSHARSTMSIAASIIHGCQSLLLIVVIVIHCPPSVNLVLPMTFVTSTVHQPTFAPNNAPVPNLQGTLNPYL